MGRGGAAARRGRGRGRSGAMSSALTRAHTALLAHNYFVEATDPMCGWLRLPEPFSQAMAGRRPQGLYLRMEGWSHGSTWVATTFGNGGTMYLDQAWAAFVRWRNIQQF